jgi:hypothetical protein
LRRNSWSRSPKYAPFEAALNKLTDDFALNIRVAPADVHPIVPHVLLEESHLGGANPNRLGRYVRPKVLQSAPLLEDTIEEEGPPRDLLTDHYLRVSGPLSRVIQRRHNELSNRFKRWLVERGAQNITVESEQVDCECIFLDQRYRFELKTCADQLARRALREALGQILEYAYYPGRAPCDHLAIVLDTPPAQGDLAWFRRLFSSGLPIELYWLKGTEVYSAGITDQSLAQPKRQLNVAT